MPRPRRGRAPNSSPVSRPAFTASSSTPADSAGVGPGGAAHDLEGAAGDPLQLAQVLVVPAPVAAAAEEPVGAVVGDDHPVALQRFGYDPGAAAEAAEAVAGLEAQPHSHRRGAGAGCVAGAVGGGVDPGVAGALEGDPDRVVEAAVGDLVVADEAGEDRQPGGVGRGPGVRPQGARAQVPADAGVGVPVGAAAAGGEGAIEVGEDAAGAGGAGEGWGRARGRLSVRGAVWGAGGSRPPPPGAGGENPGARGEPKSGWRR